MNRNRDDQFVIMMISIAAIALIIENILKEWELWIHPLVFVGIVCLWVMHIKEKPERYIRQAIYFVYTAVLVFYHGVHTGDIFGILVVMMPVLISFAFLEHIYMMNLFLAEYILIMLLRVAPFFPGNELVFDVQYILRILLHVTIVIAVYLCCVRLVRERVDTKANERKKDEKIIATEKDMDDFLSNISHELRTPVNVVSGMSDILIKREPGEEVFAIKEAGFRLTGQIDDIQDYTEARRGEVLVEEENYMSTSLINDVVTAFRTNADVGDLELVVDMSPDMPTMMKGDVKKLHKIFRHLMGNAIKFTKEGGILIRLYQENKSYGVNLCIEMIDTGIGMHRKEIAALSDGMFQANKKRNRSSGGVGLGLSIVYGFVHAMGGFVKIKSSRGSGTTVRVTVPQKVVDQTPCLMLSSDFEGDVVFHVRSDKYSNPKLRDFYRIVAVNLARNLGVSLYPAETIKELKNLIDRKNVAFIFMGEEEYTENASYFNELSMGDIVVAVSARDGFSVPERSRVILMPKPLYAYPVVKVLSDGLQASELDLAEHVQKPDLTGIRALVVDDEPMNLVVAMGLFTDYGMITETAGSGRDALNKFSSEDYDVIFMDHMMPEMDGVETMKLIREMAEETERQPVIIALTANVVSGAREMFMREGFDGFIGKPIDLYEFERVMNRLLIGKTQKAGGEE
ncbi:MAG: response regulator [Eubacterium sp.]|nr:response regulator [Eubacterium sp.]